MNNQYICKSVENKIIKLLKPNNNDRMIAKKLAYVREYLDLRDYVGYDELIMQLEELEECDNCKELEERDEMIGVQELGFCRNCNEHYL